MSDEEAQEHFDNFFEDVFVECEDKVSFSARQLKNMTGHLFVVWRNRRNECL